MRIVTASTFRDRAIVMRRTADGHFAWTYADTGWDLHLFDTAQEAARWERFDLRIEERMDT